MFLLNYVMGQNWGCMFMHLLMYVLPAKLQDLMKSCWDMYTGQNRCTHIRTQLCKWGVNLESQAFMC